MASDVTDEEDIGRYRGFDIEDDIPGETDLKVPTNNDNKNLESSAVTTSTEAASDSTTIAALLKQIDQQASTIAKLEADLASNTNEKDGKDDGDSKMKKRKRNESVMDTTFTSDSQEKDTEIRILTERISELERKLAEKEKQPEPTSKPTKPTMEDKSNKKKPTCTLSTNLPLSNITTLLQDLQKGVEKKITDMKESIEASMEEKIAKAIATNKTNKLTYASAAATDDNGISGLQATKQGNEFRTLIAETKNEEILSENDRQRREMNIIIHGVKEGKEVSDIQIKESDKTYVKALFAILGLTISVKSITRLGKINLQNENCRPIKLVMNSTEDKQLVMSRLSNLKSAEDQYRNISVKDDYTPSERELIKSKLKQAQELNERENTNEWKVRGTPKNGLRIVKIKTKPTSGMELSSTNPPPQPTITVTEAQ